jgi:hypothetical protein
LQELLGPSACRLPYILRHQPTLLSNAQSTLQDKLQLLQQLLCCSRDDVSELRGGPCCFLHSRVLSPQLLLLAGHALSAVSYALCLMG